MALADDFFMFAADAPEEPAEPTAELPEEREELTGHRKSRPSRVRRAVEKDTAEEGQLARMVRELRDLEDLIVGKLTATERLLAQLESRRIHEDGGYSSPAEFEDRMLASAPTLRSMRLAVPTPAPRFKLTLAKRDQADARLRQTKALTAIARALDRIRSMDAEIHQAASAARAKLYTIEGMRVYDECGYTSFEEFLERALGPSPVLASAVTLVGDEPPVDLIDAPAAVEENVSTDETMDFSSFFVTSPDPSGEALPASAEADAAAEAASESPPAPPRRGPRVTVVYSLLLCVLGTLGGAAAGVWSGQPAAVPVPPVSTTVAPREATPPGAPHAAVEPPSSARARHPLSAPVGSGAMKGASAVSPLAAGAGYVRVDTARAAH